MQLFRSEEQVDAWAKHTSYTKGHVFSPRVLWELAARWWDDRLRLDWRRKSLEERQAILEEVGLTGEFWRLSADG